MSTYLKKYLERLKQTGPGLAKSVEETVQAVIPNHIESFSFQGEMTGLLLGNVQSGKTSHMFGIIAAAADMQLDLFIILTTDNTLLQQQTLQRALELFDSFNVCGENDEMRFLSKRMRQPVILVLKKNSKVLQTWRNNLSSSGFCQGRPLFIIDDEGDAASLNTRVNQDDQSTINRHLEEIKRLGASTIYLQVTATPQSILLQRAITGWRPSFIHYFHPGKKYLGGDFFYSEPRSFAVRTIAEDELDRLLEDDLLAVGMQSALLSFLVSGAHLILKKQVEICNFLVHPSVRIADQEAVAERIGEYLNQLLADIRDENPEILLKDAWDDLQQTKPDLVSLEKIGLFVHEALENEGVGIRVLNSRTRQVDDQETPFTIIVGGNTLGRGITFNNLQTVYYCRRARTPQADTFWQHSRMFGYDRDRGLMRVYLPPSLATIFTQLNNANKALIDQIVAGNIDRIQLLYPPNVRPTRTNVIDRDALRLLVGGVNYFPFEPDGSHTDELDRYLMPYPDKGHQEITSDEACELLELAGSPVEGDWSGKAFINCIKAIESNLNHSIKVILIVRRNRDIARGTGTLLSPNDRGLGRRYPDRVVLTLYRVSGTADKGWDGNPLWIPNIKMPFGANFYNID